ncbi:MAG: MFS transporter [Gammaproteobacteria bacterium]|nr:MFS transporter [Gammaproteobacteria bacterium]
MMHNDKMSDKEWRGTLSLASIYSARMLGLFMILPVFSVYAQTLRGTSPFLIGLALGVYGLAQACLQIPFGLVSDIIGRKRVIFIGLCLFALGSVVAASSHTIIGVIIGRALQGTGAIGSTLTALLADLTREQYRTKAMTVIGMTIAISFSVAMIAGPVIDAVIGVNGIFWVSAVLAVAGIVILWLLVPPPERVVFHSDAELTPVYLREILANRELLQQDFSIFMLHAILTSTFIAVPIAISHIAGFALKYHGLVYLAALVPAFFLMVPFVIIAEKKRRMKQVYLLAIFTIMLTQLLLLLWDHSYVLMSLALFLFFTAFITLEALIPSLVSKIAPAGRKGTALGIYSSLQFFGMFLGGAVGGAFLHFHNIDAVFLFSLALALVWFLVSLVMKEPRYVSSYAMRIGVIEGAAASQLQEQLCQLPGVIDAVIDCQAESVYLKIDRKVVDMEALQAVIATTQPAS